MNHRGTQRIRTQRLLLRPMAIGDAEAMFYNWANNPEVTRYLTWRPHDNIAMTAATIRNWVMQYGNQAFYLWGIELNGMLIGSISAHTSDESIRSTEVGYVLSQHMWGQGIMTEALAAVLEYLFSVGFNRIYARHRLENPASGRVMQKCGMRYEGVIRQSGLDAYGYIHDMMQYSIVASDRVQ